MDTKVFSSGVHHSNLPESYIRPGSETPRLGQVSECKDVPIVAEASRTFSISQVEEKLRLNSEDSSKTTSLCTSFKIDRIIAKLYREAVRGLEEYTGESLDEQGQHMPGWIVGISSPSCPQPQLVYGLTGHTDPNALEILLQDLHVAGLQVNGNWLAVNSHPNAFVIKGYQLQSLRNELYKSVWQHAVVNADKPHAFCGSFLCLNDEALDNPAKHGLKPYIEDIHMLNIIRSFGAGT